MYWIWLGEEGASCSHSAGPVNPLPVDRATQTALLRNVSKYNASARPSPFTSRYCIWLAIEAPCCSHFVSGPNPLPVESATYTALLRPVSKYRRSARPSPFTSTYRIWSGVEAPKGICNHCTGAVKPVPVDNDTQTPLLRNESKYRASA